MKLNLEFYKKEKEIEIAEKEIIHQYIEKFSNYDYEENFDEMITDKEIYYLSSCSQNILNWYPFKKEDEVLEIGGDLGQITQIFTTKTKEVITTEPNLEKAKAIAKRYEKEENLEIIVGNLQEIKLQKKFDYIVLIGIMPRLKEVIGKNIKLMDVLKMLESNLKQNGKFLVAVDNQFGLRYFAGNPENMLNQKFKSLTGYSDEPERMECFTKSKIKEQLENINYKANFYYPLPDYRIPNVIFSDKQQAKYNSVDKYDAYCNENSTIIMNEIDVFREILKSEEEMFSFFANSFLMEISKQEMPIKYQYISFNNMRKENYRLITKITEEYVEKEIVNEKAHKHYDNIKENIDYMKENKIKTVDYVENGNIKSKYMKQEKLLNNVIVKALENKDQDLVDHIMEQYRKILENNTYQEVNYENTVFAKYNIEIEDKEIIQQMHFQKKGLWDMTFKNCFYLEDEFYFFDQEWMEENLPAEYILYRSILYTISLRRFVNIEEWFEKYELTKYRKIFEALDNQLQEKIRNHNSWCFYSQNKYFDIDATKQEIENAQIRSEAQKAALENLKQENETIRQEYEQYRKIQERKLTNRIKRKVKKVIKKKG